MRMNFSPIHVNTLVQLVNKMMNVNLKGTYNVGSNDGMNKKNLL